MSYKATTGSIAITPENEQEDDDGGKPSVTSALFLIAN
jgi:hypothetical protein